MPGGKVMRRVILTAFFLMFYSITPTAAQEQFEMDVISTSKGNLAITLLKDSPEIEVCIRKMQ
jgi:hypothetical protein